MNILIIVGVAAVILFAATRIYPFWIAKVFDENDDNPPPSVRCADDRDYVKTPTQIVFAHHFASIAGAGPIIGPILALVFGWLPALIWIIVGGIFYGAVHDMCTMFVSVREGGKTIAEIARRTLGKGGYLLFVSFLLLVLSLVNAIFLKFSAGALTSTYDITHLGENPGRFIQTFTDNNGVVKGRIGGIATTSVIVMTLVAPILGLLIHRGKLRGLVALLIATAVCVTSVMIGFAFPVVLPTVGRLGPVDLWQIILTVYVFLACWIPVWLVLQPRDYMNVQILYGGIVLLLVATIAAGFGGVSPQLPAESINASSKPLWPFVFITIACGAISGFHSLVATGTTSKQIPRESDCRRVGYQAMILESFLAVLVVVAVASQLSPDQHHALVHPSSAARNPILAFALACGGMFNHLGIPTAVGCVLGILIIEGFLITTLDTAVRLGRYLFEELWVCLFGDDHERTPALLRHPIVNTGCTVALMLLFAYSKEAYDALWPFFGAGNQLIGALALTTVSIWLLERRKTCWFTAIPAVFMVVTAITALGWSVVGELQGEGKSRFVVAGAGGLLLLLAVGFVAVATLRVRKAIRTAREPIRSR